MVEISASVTFTELPTDLRKRVFKERCLMLNQKLQKSKKRWCVGIHSSYSPGNFPFYDIDVHVDGPNGKVFCFVTRNRYRCGQHVNICEYRQYDKGYLEIYMDNSHGKWETYKPCTIKCEYPGRPRDTEYYK